MRVIDPKSNEPYHQGMRLPAMPAVHEPEAIIVPAGTFRIGRLIDMFNEGNIERARLLHVLDRGNEFERCTFEIVAPTTKPT